jgi:hypothetical protein
MFLVLMPETLRTTTSIRLFFYHRCAHNSPKLHLFLFGVGLLKKDLSQFHPAFRLHLLKPKLSVLDGGDELAGFQFFKEKPVFLVLLLEVLLEICLSLGFQSHDIALVVLEKHAILLPLIILLRLHLN